MTENGQDALFTKGYDSDGDAPFWTSNNMELWEEAIAQFNE